MAAQTDLIHKDLPYACRGLTLSTSIPYLAMASATRATGTVPSAASFIQGKKYQANPAIGVDWNKDSATAGIGFACLKYEMSTPQYFMYNYLSDSSATTTGTWITATANGDLNGDGTLSTFTLLGGIAGGELLLAPAIAEVNPEE